MSDPIIAPLASAQLAVWLHEQEHVGLPLYQDAVRMRLGGVVDVGRFERALEVIRDRHETLRTTFELREGRPVQLIWPTMHTEIDLMDLSNLPAGTRVARAKTLIEARVRQSVDLQVGPLVECFLVRLAEDDHFLVLKLHHIVLDAPGINRFFAEFFLYYAAQSGESFSPPPAPVQQFRHVVEDERAWFDSDEYRKLRDFWQTELDGAETIDLGARADRNRAAGAAGAFERFRISNDVHQQLANLAEAQDATRFMVFLAAFKLVIQRYSGQDDILVAAAGRRRSPELDELICSAANPLALRTHLDGDPTFRELVDRVSETCRRAYAHREFPFQHLVSELRLARAGSRSPLFQVMFTLLRTRPANWGSAWEGEIAGLKVMEWEMVDTGTSRFDLTVSLQEDTSSIAGWVEYKTELFDRKGIAALVRYFQNALRACAEDPDRPISQIDFMDPGERSRVLRLFDGQRTEPQRFVSIDAAFIQQADATPEATAVTHEGEVLTYADLLARARRVARKLQSLGVQPQDHVGVFAERSSDAVIAIVGILLAGGAYVPLNRSYPVDRLRFMVRDARVQVVVTTKQLMADATNIGGSAFAVDGEWEDAVGSGAPVIMHNAAADIAYVMYTSGTTGHPKGVAMPHGSIANLIQWQDGQSKLGPDTRTLQFAALSFDVSCQEIFSTLCFGGTLVIRPAEKRFDPEELWSLVTHEAVNRVFLPPVALEQVAVVAAQSSAKTALQEIVCAGEALRITEKIRALAERIPGLRLQNQYGPTETHVATAHTLTGPAAEWPTWPPIGRPIRNTSLYILDKAGNPLPPGCRGELYIAGAGVARGYLGRPELNEERFLDDSFDDLRSRCMYRTGDFVRSTDDGCLEFIGRVDKQVKIGGYRVELEELETALLEIPSVKEAAVLLVGAGTARALVAFVAIEGAPLVSEFRTILARRLPREMIPRKFVCLEALPRTSNGKIDRTKLAAIRDREASLEPVQLEGSPFEQRLQSMWAEVLGRTDVGLEDDFFELGGDSLAAVELAAALSESFDEAISVRFVLDFPDVASAAAALSDRAAQQDGEVDTLPDARTDLTPQNSPISYWQASSVAEQIDAAAIAYIPSNLETAQVSDQIADWLDGRPRVASLHRTPMGTIGIVLIPRGASRLYGDVPLLEKEILDAVDVAGSAGAKCVSLTGLLPSATGDYAKRLSTIANNPPITTGHATTSAAVVLSIEQSLAVTSRDMRRERVGFLGLGSVGSCVLRLMLAELPHPSSLILCDAFSNAKRLNELGSALTDEFAFEGDVQVLTARPNVQDDFYLSTLIVGATNSPDVLLSRNIRPGTIIVDDSAPYCVSAPDIIQRMHHRRDVIATEGGLVHSPVPLQHSIVGGQNELKGMGWVPYLNAFEITGCVLSSVLSINEAAAPRTSGTVSLDVARMHYRALRANGFRGAELQFGGQLLTPELLALFRKQFNADAYQ